MEALKFVEITPPERKRTYIFPGDVTYTVENVCWICVRESGTHRLITVDGKKVIVSKGWVAIELDMDQFSL